MSVLSVVVPAHNEGPLVAANLHHLLNGARPDEFEIVVVANGCSDDTAHCAAAITGVNVIEIDAASKIAALNAGDAAATVFPRAYVDADVRVSAATLRALARALATDAPRIASPRLHIDTSGSSLAVRAYYRVWAMSDYRARGHIGSGIYAVNQAGRERWGEFPDVIADDRFVQQRFLLGERTTLDDQQFTVRASKDMGTHIRRGARIERGNRELPDDVQLEAHEGASVRYRRLLRAVAKRPSLWAALPFYVFGYGAARVRSRRVDGWNRDESARIESRA